MATRLEWLPVELLDSISTFLPFKDLLNLWRCSRAFRRLLEPKLFVGPDAPNQTMHWACKTGDIPVLRKAVTEYSMNPSSFTIAVPKGSPPSTTDQVVRVYTLPLACRRGYPETFSTLLSLGAELNEMEDDDLRDFAKQLLRPQSRGMLSDLAAANLSHGPLSCLFGEAALVEAIELDLPADVVMDIAKYDTDVVNEVCRWDSSHEAAIPLTAAMALRDAGPMFKTLIDQGAEVRGRLMENSWTSYYYSRCQAAFQRHRGGMVRRQSLPLARTVPIFAAAQHFAQTGSTELLDLCLNNGDDIDRLAPLLAEIHGSYLFSEPSLEWITVTPLIAYLICIPDWAADAKLSTAPVDGIKYFLAHGARRTYAGWADTALWYPNETWFGCIPFDESPTLDSPVEVLLDVWGVSMLRERRFFDTLKHLVDEGFALPKKTQLAERYKSQHEVYHGFRPAET